MTTRPDRRGRPTRAELLARVEALTAEARSRGWVEVREEAAPFVAPTDPRVVEHVPLGSGWARYTLRLKDGTIVLEGGARRVWIVPQKAASAMVAEAARRAVDGAHTLHHLLALLLRATLGGSGRTPVERAIADEGLVPTLQERIRQRAPAETQRVTEPELLALLHQLVTDDAVVKALKRDRTLPAEVLAGLGQVPERPDPAAALEQEVADRLAAGAVGLDASVVGSVARDTAAVDGGRRWWAFGARLADGSLHLEGGARRLRVLPPKAAGRLVDARIAEVLDGSDLRVLLHIRARARGRHHTTDLQRALASRPKDLAALDARICALAPEASANPPLAPKAVAMLTEAGVDDATVRRLRRARDLTPEELARIEERAAAPPPAQSASARLDSLIAAATADRWVELREDVVPYLPTDDPSIEELLSTRKAPGLQHAALLTDGAVHLEGGRTRVRMCPQRAVEPLLRARWTRILGETDLHVLLDLAIRAREQTAQPTLHGWVAARPDRRAALLAHIKDRASDPAYAGRITRRPQLDVLAEAGVDAADLAALGSKLLLPGVAASAAGRPAAASRPPAGDRLADLIAERAAKGWVEVHEDVAPYLPDDDPAIAERVPSRAVPWTRLIAVLDDGSLHLEGGRQRVRLCPPRTAARLTTAAARRVLEGDDLLALLDLAVRSRRHPPSNTIWHHMNANPAMWDGLLARIRELSREARWEGRIQRRSWQEILSLAGVDAMRRLFLEGVVHHAGQEASARGAESAAERAASAAEARLLSVLSEKIARGWVTLPTGAVPYVDERDPRVRDLFRDPDPDHRFAAILDDGTVVHEGGTSRWWLVPPDRAGAVVERHAWEMARAGEIHGLLDLLLSSGSTAARHPLTALVAARPDLRRSIEDRIRAAARSGRHRFTRPEHLDLLRALGVPPRRGAP